MIKPSYLSCGLSLLALAIVAFCMLIPLPYAAEDDVLERHFRNLLHVPLFFVITVLLRCLQTSFPLKWSSLGWCASLAFLLGVTTELAQSFTGRSCSPGDMVSNLGGILLACAFLLRSPDRRHTKIRSASVLVGLAILVATMVPLVTETFTVRAKHANFPNLLDLEHPGGLWNPQGNTRIEVVKSDQGVALAGLEVSIAQGSYEGLRYVMPWGTDVLDYSGLEIGIDNPGEAFELGVRLDGEKSLRQYRSIIVPPGRSMLHTQWVAGHGDGKLKRVVLFTGENQPARRFMLLSARLIGKFPASDPADP